MEAAGAVGVEEDLAGADGAELEPVPTAGDEDGAGGSGFWPDDINRARFAFRATSLSGWEGLLGGM